MSGAPRARSWLVFVIDDRVDQLDAAIHARLKDYQVSRGARQTKRWFMGR